MLLKLTMIKIIKHAFTTLSHQQQLLTQLQEIGIAPKPSIFVEEGQKYNRKLTQHERTLLKMLIPKPNFSNRMTRQDQATYRQAICQKLYQQQQQHLRTGVRVLQLNHSSTVDSYINSIYKDVFCRFLVSKGIGVQWKSNKSQYGMMNGHHERNISAFHDWLFDMLRVYPLGRRRTVGLYSYHLKQYINIKDVDVEKVHKLAQFITLQLNEFGKYGEQFQILKEKGSKVKLLVAMEEGCKLIKPIGLCLQQKVKMIILKHNHLQEYLITSMDVFAQFRAQFSKNYQKHQLLDSHHLLGMKAEGLSILSQISSYERRPGFYLIDPHSNLPDFERAQQHELPFQQSYIDESGNIWIEDEKVCSVVDTFATQKISKKLPSIEFMDMHLSYEDQIYSYKEERLHFRIGQKYIIEIPQKNYQILTSKINGSKQSKVTFPNTTKFSKPRDKRAHKKLIKALRKQKTPYMSLQQCIHSIQQIPVSTLQDSQIKIPVYLQNDQIIPYTSKEQLKTPTEGENVQIKYINVSKDLLQTFECLNASKMSSIVIEPQSTTEEILPYVLHLQSMMHLRHRATRNQSIFKFIKLHPTIIDQQKNLNIQELVFGALKSNKESQYGAGFEAVRLWTCANDTYLGDRQLADEAINKQMKNSAFMRKLYWQVMPLLTEFEEVEYDKMNYLDKFMIDHINYYIQNMEEAYTELELEKAYKLTMDFFKHYVHEIYIKTIRHKIMTYPDDESNRAHNYVLHQIVGLLGVLAPIFPFSAYHVSRTPLLKWPSIKDRVRVELIPSYNRMTKLRVEIRNKLILNNFQHAQIQLPEGILLSDQDIELFFGVRVGTPQEQMRSCSVKLKQNHPIGQAERIRLHEFKDVCIRCSPKYYSNHLCSRCHDYLLQ